jgi:hypothetical protein
MHPRQRRPSSIVLHRRAHESLQHLVALEIVEETTHEIVLNLLTVPERGPVAVVADDGWRAR